MFILPDRFLRCRPIHVTRTSSFRLPIQFVRCSLFSLANGFSFTCTLGSFLVFKLDLIIYSCLSLKAIYLFVLVLTKHNQHII